MTTAAPDPARHPARLVALLGAESTGKTRLAQALADGLAARRPALRVTWVEEWLRTWCDRHGRTPRRDEQAAIAATQAQRIAQALAGHDVVFADTTPLMTAVYSEHVFGDASLTASALAWQRTHVDATLVTDTDLGWESDGVQRDGPQAQRDVDARLRALLDAAALPWRLVQGDGPARVAAARAALASLGVEA